MESAEVDIKPIIPTGDVLDRNLLTVPGAGIGKLKQSRYEDVWPEDVHAAFMEAVALYPPMGKRRLKYYRVSSTHENEHFSDTNRAKSFGRCQLIQSYILEKTGKNRSRKQVSSHLQRLKKIHKDNPAMRPFFSERSQPPLEHCSASQAVAISSHQDSDIFANISFSTRNLKSDFDLTVNPQNTDTGVDSSPTFPYVSDALTCDSGSCNAPDLSTNYHNQPSVFFPQEFPSPQQCLAGTPRPCDSDYLSELQDPSPFKDAVNGGFRAGSIFNTSAFSISMRRLASRLPIQGRADPFPTTHLPRAVHTPAFQSAHQWISHDGLVDGITCNSSLAPAQQLLHTPFHPLYLFPLEKRLDHGLASDWTWPQNLDVSFGPREGNCSDILSRYSPAVYQRNLAYPEMKVIPPRLHSSPSESDVLRVPYSYVATSPATVSESISSESAIDFPGQGVQASSENLASPPVIMPTPVYPVSYIHSDGAHTYALPSTLLP